MLLLAVLFALTLYVALSVSIYQWINGGGER